MREIIIIILIIIVFFIVVNRRESFATKKDKAESIFNWFNSNPNPSYNAYRNGVKPSNIVEYEDTLNLFKTKNFTVDTIESVL